MTCNSFYLAKFHSNYSEKLSLEVSMQPHEVVSSQSSAESRKLFNMDNQVGYDIHRTNSYTRLKVSSHGILYATITPEHKTEKFSLQFFSDRFPTFIVILESKRGVFISENNKIIHKKTCLKDALSEYEKKYPKNELATDLISFDDGEIWEKYYDSQYLKTRDNKKYFLRSIPKKLHGNSGLKTEVNRFSKSKRITDFI